MNNFEVFIITYNESNGESNYRYIQKNFFLEVQKIEGIKGISAAYQEVFKRCEKEYVYIVEGDHNIHEDFRFENGTSDKIIVYPSINISNQALSGNSGVMLFPVNEFKDWNFNKIDILWDIPEEKIVYSDIVASYNQFINSEFHTFSHTVRQNLKLRYLRDAGDQGAQALINLWESWDLHNINRVNIIKTAWNFASTLDYNNLDPLYFDNYDLIKKDYIRLADQFQEPEEENDDGIVYISKPASHIDDNT